MNHLSSIFSKDQGYHPVETDSRDQSSDSQEESSSISSKIYGFVTGLFQRCKCHHEENYLDNDSDIIINSLDRDIDLDEQDIAIENDQKQKFNVQENTLFQRCQYKDVFSKLPEGTTGEEDIDVVMRIDNKTNQMTYGLVIEKQELRRIPLSSLKQMAFLSSACLSALLAYGFLGQGIIFKSLVVVVASVAVPKIVNLSGKYLPPLSIPILGAGLCYYSVTLLTPQPNATLTNETMDPNGTMALNGTSTQQSFTDGILYASYLSQLSLAVCGLYIKRCGKGFSKDGLPGLKQHVIPKICNESSLIRLKDRVFKCCSNEELPESIRDVSEETEKIVKIIEIQPSDQSFKSDSPIYLVYTVYDKEMSVHIRIGDRNFESRKMITGADDEDSEDEDDHKVEKKPKVESKKDGKKEKKLKKVEGRDWTWVKKGALFGGSLSLTVGSKYLWGEGLITTAFNTILSASVKAQLRLEPVLNSYLILSAATVPFICIKIINPSSFVGDFVFVPVSTLISLMNKQFKDRVTGKEDKNGLLWKTPLSFQKLAQEAGCRFEPYQPFQHPFKDVISKDYNSSLSLEFNANEIHASNPEAPVQAAFKIKGGKLTGKYQNLTKEELQNYQLARIKGEKIGPYYETAFLVLSIGTTYLSIYLTQQSSLKGIDTTRIKAEDLGESALTTILNSVFVTFIKQTAKKFTPAARYGTSIPVAVGALALQGYLLKEGKLLFVFAGPIATPPISIIGMQCKKWVQGKPYGKTKGYITSSWPTDNDLDDCTSKIQNSCSKFWTCSNTASEDSDDSETELEKIDSLVIVSSDGLEEDFTDGQVEDVTDAYEELKDVSEKVSQKPE